MKRCHPFQASGFHELPAVTGTCAAPRHLRGGAGDSVRFHADMQF